MIVNVWIALRLSAEATVIESLQWDEDAQGPYTGPLRAKSRKLFTYMKDGTTRRRLFSTATIAGEDYNE
jgi:hypothetical protein